MEKGPRIRLIVWKAAKAIEQLDRASIAETGLHLTDFMILEVLLHKGPLPINTIGAKVLLTSGSMTAAVKRVERKGLVRRLQDPTDGRCFHVHLTDAGRRVIERAFARHEKKLDKMADVLTASERSELVRLLKKIGYNAQKMHDSG